MALIDTDDERGIVAAVAALTDCNPFVPERIELEKRILGADFVPFGLVWYADADAGVFDPNLGRLRERIEQLAADLHRRLAAGGEPTTDEQTDYRALVFYLLWLRYEDDWLAVIKAGEAGGAPKTCPRGRWLRYLRKRSVCETRATKVPEVPLPKIVPTVLAASLSGSKRAAT